MEKPMLWDIWRDCKRCGQAPSHLEAQKIVKALQKMHPTSSFRVQYTGKDLGIRREEEFIG